MTEANRETPAAEPGADASDTGTIPNVERLSKVKGTGLTKKAQLIRLLGSKHGADLQTLAGKLGWQPHTTRAALSRLRKAGYVLTAESAGEGKPLRYRITGTPPAGDDPR